MSKFGRATRPAGERPREDDPHSVLRAASCDAAEQRLYSAHDGLGRCYSTVTRITQAEHCPVGWKLVGTSGTGCLQGLLGEPFGIVPICEKESFTGDKIDCCAFNDGTDIRCQPQFCTQNLDEEPCYSLIRDDCFVDRSSSGFMRQFCKEYALKDEHRGKAEVRDAVRFYCKETEKGQKDPFCSCMNADDASLCKSSTCFAKLFPNQIEQAVCFAPECIANARPDSVFVPKKEGGCADLCVSQIAAIEGGTIKVGEALNQITFCGNSLSEADLKRIKDATKLNDSEILRARQAYRAGKGDLNELKRISAAAQKRIDGTNGTNAGSDGSDTDGDSPLTQDAGGIPVYAWIIIAGLLLLGLIAGLVWWLVQTKKKKANPRNSNRARSNRNNFSPTASMQRNSRFYGPYSNNSRFL